jgi:hypothetical protein
MQNKNLLILLIIILLLHKNFSTEIRTKIPRNQQVFGAATANDAGSTSSDPSPKERNGRAIGIGAALAIGAAIILIPIIVGSIIIGYTISCTIKDKEGVERNFYLHYFVNTKFLF